MSVKELIDELNEIEKERRMLKSKLRELGFLKSYKWGELMKKPEVREIYLRHGQALKEELREYLERHGLVR